MQVKRPSNNGQATVEFALMLPIFVASIVFMLGVLSICINQLALNDEARSAVRTASTADNPEEAVHAFLRSNPASFSVRETDNGIISVEIRQPIRMFFFSLPLGPLQLRASASMMREPPIVLG